MSGQARSQCVGCIHKNEARRECPGDAHVVLYNVVVLSRCTCLCTIPRPSRIGEERTIIS